MKIFFAIALYGLLSATHANIHAQGENNVWAFGHHNGLRFNTNPPTFFQSNNFSSEGSASVSDAAGNVLFYSNGRTIWDANGTVMPNGDGLQGNGPATSGMFGIMGSSAQGVAIVKSLANAGQYYLFTLDASEDITPTYTGYLRYSVIDMNLNGGQGDVVAGQKDILLDDNMSEMMTVTKGAGCYYWLIAHKSNSATYRVFKIDGTGIGQPVSSTAGSAGLTSTHIKVSFAGNRILNQSIGIDGTEIGTFDNATGVISNVITILHGSQFHNYGSCFSPDDHKIYLSSMNGILQYDITAYPNVVAVTATQEVITTDYYSQLRNGPDGKIYIAAWNKPFISTISNPNSAGLACNFNPAALPQTNWSDFGLLGAPVYGHGLGSDVVVADLQEPSFHVMDTLVCAADTFRLNGPGGFQEYLWNDHSTDDFHNVTASGQYWVRSNNSCQQRIDSFDVKMVDFGADLGPDTFLCPDGQISLNPAADNATYLWQDGTIEPVFNVTKPGNYSVIVTKENCVRNDNITIAEVDPFLSIIKSDSVLCLGTFIQLHAQTNLNSTYLWNNGSTDETITVNEEGNYTVAATNACGTLNQSVNIEARRCDCGTSIPNAFSPNKDGLNDVFQVGVACPTRNYLMSIYNRFGQRVFVSTTITISWDGSYKGNVADVGIYFYTLSFAGPKGDIFEEKGEVTLLR